MMKLNLNIALLALLGAALVAFVAQAGWWWIAHHMTWWTFALASTGWIFLFEIVKSTIKELRK